MLNVIFILKLGNRFNQYSLVFGHADGGTLRELLKDKFQSLKWVDKISLGSQLASSITCLHDEGIVHGDLNSQNILIHQNSIKLVDFGQTKEVSKELSNMPYNDPKLFNRRGNNVSNKKNDVFGVGVLLWEISSGTPPFKDEPYDSYFDFQGRREVPVPGTPEDYKKIYTECWDDETKRRPEMRDV
ncbi:3715_t:CDS:2 [Funneliformis geosporum]|uniref:3715_t:CDS:1 n=1 Tax=Funneliformis geosporum TaxID=1117311 RepID=A0A9W4SLX3_9GLOM|nr:3715_t:CDS:2 [Funneliformis geosporum]